MESIRGRKRRNTRNHYWCAYRLSILPLNFEKSLLLIQHVTSPVLYCPILSCPILPCPTLPCLPYFTLPCCTLSYYKSHPASPLTVTQKVDLNYIENLRSTIFPALHIGLALDLDSATTVTGSCSFRTGTPGADGSPIAVGVSHWVCQSKCRATREIKLRENNVLIKFFPHPSLTWLSAALQPSHKDWTLFESSL